MGDIPGSSSTKNDKPVIVRVKRKAFQSRLEGFWLEINERPLKKQLLDFEKLSLSEPKEQLPDSGKLSLSEPSERVEECKAKKIFVRHVETVSSSEVSVDILQSFVPNNANACKSDSKSEDRRRSFKAEKIQDQLHVKAKREQEFWSKNARFEQIWRSRRGKKEMIHDEAINEICRFYDVVRVDVEEATSGVQEEHCSPRDTDLEDYQIMHTYLPLLREFIPSAAEEIESDINDYVSKKASKDDYVFDLYAVKDDINTAEEDASNPFPLVQVDDDDDFYNGPSESEFESDDSNAENNPLNEYPDEETSEDDEGEMSTSSDDKSEELETGSVGNESSDQDMGHHDRSEDEDEDEDENKDVLFEDEFYDDDDDVYAHDDVSDNEVYY